ncbi:MAG: carbon-nitrogen hydrolase family protein [Kutzneria sp.]|nr:carbon-nitrogen hydrolase family protein [Kutzneria sp.]
MRLGLCQLTSTPDKQANLALVGAAMATAAERGAQIAVFPEATMARFGTPLRPVAEPLDGPWANAVRELAVANGVVAMVGMFTPADDGRVHNTLLVTSAHTHLGYDKIHLFDAFGFTESATVAPGEPTVVVDLDGVRVGLAICYDLRFPGLFTTLADQGATVIVVPASWGGGPGKREQWELLVRARALDSTSWVLGCGQAPPDTGAETGKAPTGIGHSIVADPFGRVHARLGEEPGILVVDVDPAMAAEARAAIPVLANRRL